MTRSRPPQNTFSSGEISPLLHRRWDYKRWQTGLAACQGFLPLRQGGATRAPGTLYRGTTAGNAPARLIEFEFAANDTLILEFTANLMRVWRYGALVESGGSPFTLATPFGADVLPTLSAVQSADVIYLADGVQPIQKLSRLALDDWTIEPLEIEAGPFRVQNLDEDKKLTGDTVGSDYFLDASWDFFEADHLGSLIRIVPEDYADIPLWAQQLHTKIGNLFRYGTRIYRLYSSKGVTTVGLGGKTGWNPPEQEDGRYQASTDPDVVWDHVSDGIGIARVLEIVSPTRARVEIVRELPDTLWTASTYRWSEGAWSDRYGYPAALEEVDGQRLAAAATPTDPRTVWFSAVADYEDFEPGTDEDDSFAYAIAGGRSLNRILWLRRGQKGLYIGALGEEFVTTTTDASRALTPTTTEFESVGTIGSHSARPIAPLGRPIFISKDRGRVIEVDYSLQSDALQERELSLPSDHLGAARFAAIVWQNSRSTGWLRRAAGDLVAMIYDPSESVLGWAPVPVAGGVIENLAVTLDADGAEDILTMVVRREIDGQTVRMIEEQALVWGVLSGAQPIAEAVHFFAAAVFTPDPATDTFSVPHLAGETVYAWTDAGQFGPLTVAGDGTVTLDAAVTRATIGLFDDSHYIETLDIRAAAPDGESMGRPRRQHAGMGLAVHRTAALRAAGVERDLGQPPRVTPAQDLLPLPVGQDLSAAYSGVTALPVATGHATEQALRLYPVGGAPATVQAVVPVIEEGGA